MADAAEREPTKRWTDWVIVPAVVLVVTHRLRLGGGILYADAALALAATIGFLQLFRGRNRTGALLRSLAPWLWLYVLVQIGALFGSGLSGWALDASLRNTFPIFFFVGILALFVARPRSLALAYWTLLACSIYVALGVLVDESTRGSGPFTNPAYAGYFLAAAGLFVLTQRLAWPLRGGLLALYAWAILDTASFGAMFLFAGGAAYLVWRAVARFRPRIIVRVVLILLVAPIAASGVVADLVPEDDSGSGPLSQRRWDRSSDQRVEIWGAYIADLPSHPVGAGPGASERRQPDGVDHAPHNDYITIPYEYGVLGLIAVGMIVFRIWRSTPPGSVARVLICGYLAGAAVRDTLNFRHQWLILAIAVALAWHESGRTAADDRAAEAGDAIQSTPSAVRGGD